MNSESTATLAQFCIDQHGAFEPADWVARGAVDGKPIAVAAHYLSMTSWYGHEEELGHIVYALDPELAKSAVFEREVRDGIFSLAQFAHMVRRGIAVRKIAASVKAGFAPNPESAATPQFLQI